MGSPESTFRVNTPENVTLEYDVAGIGSRFLAALVDSILILLLQILAVLAMFLLATSFGLDLAGDSQWSAWILAIGGLIAFLFLWGYYIFFELIWNGQSPGKRRVGLRVVRADGTSITLPESLIRNLIRIVDFLPLAYGVGVVTMFIDSRSRRLGDLAAGTLVVHERVNVSMQTLEAGHHSLQWLSMYDARLPDDFPAEKLGEQDLRLAEEFLRRRHSLANRSLLIAQILKTLYERAGQPVPQFADTREAEIRLIAILKAVRERNPG